MESVLISLLVWLFAVTLPLVAIGQEPINPVSDTELLETSIIDEPKLIVGTAGGVAYPAGFRQDKHLKDNNMSRATFKAKIQGTGAS